MVVVGVGVSVVGEGDGKGERGLGSASLGLVGRSLVRACAGGAEQRSNRCENPYTRILAFIT